MLRVCELPVATGSAINRQESNRRICANNVFANYGSEFVGCSEFRLRRREAQLLVCRLHEADGSVSMSTTNSSKLLK